MATASDRVTVSGELLPEYRPAWEIQDRLGDAHGGRRLAPGDRPDGPAQQAASDTIMVRYVPGPPVRTRDMTAAEVDQVKADFRHQPIEG